MHPKGSHTLLGHTLRITELDKSELSNQARIRVPYTRIILLKPQVNMPFIVGPLGVFQFSALLIVFNFLLSDLEDGNLFTA